MTKTQLRDLIDYIDAKFYELKYSSPTPGNKQTAWCQMKQAQLLRNKLVESVEETEAPAVPVCSDWHGKPAEDFSTYAKTIVDLLDKIQGQDQLIVALRASEAMWRTRAVGVSAGADWRTNVFRHRDFTTATDRHFQLAADVIGETLGLDIKWVAQISSTETSGYFTIKKAA